MYILLNLSPKYKPKSCILYVNYILIFQLILKNKLSLLHDSRALCTCSVKFLGEVILTNNYIKHRTTGIFFEGWGKTERPTLNN